jgi:hypothetical protein
MKIVLKPILKTLLTIVFSVVIHIICVKIYNYHCIGDGWFSIIQTILNVPSPHCRMLLDIMKYTSDFYILFWTTLFSSFILNYKMVRKWLTNINYNYKTYK